MKLSFMNTGREIVGSNSMINLIKKRVSNFRYSLDIVRQTVTKKLVAYAGIDPRVHESGKFKATSNRITKRGSSRLRQSLYTAVQCGITKD